MSDDNVCPKCGMPYDGSAYCWYWTRTATTCGYVDEIKTLKVGRKNWDAMVEEREKLQSELARLQSAIKQAKDEADINLEGFQSALDGMAELREQRDEARRWAKFYKWQFDRAVAFISSRIENG